MLWKHLLASADVITDGDCSGSYSVIPELGPPLMLMEITLLNELLMLQIQLVL
jgi:hypothetical protein